MKLLLLIGCFLLNTSGSVSALKCWMCMGSTQSDCARSEELSMTIQDCDVARNLQMQKLQSDPTELLMKETDSKDIVIETKCVSFIYTVSGSKVFTRGCGWIYQNTDICEYMEEIEEMHGCKWCKEDLCNTQQLDG